jgi:hypothetical protein
VASAQAQVDIARLQARTAPISPPRRLTLGEIALALWAGRGRSAVRAATLSSAGALRSFAPGCQCAKARVCQCGQLPARCPAPPSGALPGESRPAPAARGPRSAAAGRRRGPRRRVAREYSRRAASGPGATGNSGADAGGHAVPTRGPCGAHAWPMQGPCGAHAGPMQGRCGADRVDTRRCQSLSHF